MKVMNVVVPQTADASQRAGQIDAASHSQVEDFAAQASDSIDPRAVRLSEGYTDIPLCAADLLAHDLIDRAFCSADLTGPQEV
ncbi:MAG: hypothetical protein A2133_08460 [Actinobacteria bacterium RBG_16_64_13]|nr:MAG: hypothetical protein A2133_08460 [Actinobacteria bacterium RBG_16_64_13]